MIVCAMSPMCGAMRVTKLGALLAVVGGALLIGSVWLIAQAGVSLPGTTGFWYATEMCAGGAKAVLGDNAIVGFLSGNGSYMARTQCMLTQEGETDWGWVWLLVGLNALVIGGYLKIFVFWRRAYLQEQEQDRNNKLMDLAWMFLLCACCGYLSTIMMFFWPGYRLVAFATIPLVFVIWKFAQLGGLPDLAECQAFSA